MECKRNQKHLPKGPKIISMAEFTDCENWKGDCMTVAEHLIENAIGCLEDKSGYESFVESPCNKAMAESININLQHIWEMAQHVYCSIKPLWEDEVKE
jgi:hypothetical protein